MNTDHLSTSWQKVGQMYYVELADALQRRAWTEVSDMITPEFSEAVRRGDWETVGDEYMDIDSAHAIRDAMKLGTEDDVLDASMAGDTQRLRKIAHAQNAARIQSGYDKQDGRVGMG